MEGLQDEKQLFYFEHPHLRDLDLGTLWGWAVQGVSGIGHSRQSLGLGTPGVDRARRRVPGEEKS